MLTLRASDVAFVGNEAVTEASTAGLAPGEWPDFVALLKDDEDEGLLFGPAVVEPDGSRRYQSRTYNAALVILND